MKIVVMIVTPEIAADMLTRNQTNRKIRKHIVAQYVHDMESGRWVPSMTPVCITPDGNTANGGHRLTAIVRSGCAQWLLIAYDVLPTTVAMLDIGMKRTLSDVAKFMGADMNTTQAAIAKILIKGPRGSRFISFSESFDTYVDHAEAINWVIERSKMKKSGLSAPVLAIVTKAWYTQSHPRLEEFLRTMLTGVCENGDADSAAVKLRDYVRSITSGGEATRAEVYKRAQSALRAFVDEKPLKLLRGTESDYFPLPEDDE